MADAELTVALKQAKGGRKMFFAFIPKGGADGTLIVSKIKIPPKQVMDTKKEIGGGTPVTGKCFKGDEGSMMFQVVKEAPATVAAAIKKVIKRETGLTIVVDVQTAADADADEPDATTAGAAPPSGGASAPPTAGAAAPPSDSAAPGGAAAAPPGATVAPPAAPGAKDLTGIQKALQTLGYDPGKIDGKMGPHTHEAIKKFQQANGLKVDGIVGPKTQAALATALRGALPAAGGAAGKPGSASTGDAPPAAGKPGSASTGDTPPAPPSPTPPPKGPPPAGDLDLGPWTAARDEAVKDLKALATKVAGTKHPTAAGVLKEIQSIISRLPAKPALNDLDKLEEFVRTDDTITAAEEVPGHFHDLDIREPLLKALKGLK